MPLLLNPTLPHLTIPDSTIDLIGFLLTSIPILMGLLAFSERARKVAQVALSLFNLYRSFSERMAASSKPQTTVSTNGNGNGHANGNGGQSTLLYKTIDDLRRENDYAKHGLRVEADARESGDQSIAQRLDSLSERGRRDSDNFYMLYSELSRDSKKHEEDIRVLKLETAKTASQMVQMFKDQGDKLEMILHYVQPPTPPPPGAVIDLDDDSDLEAVG